MENKGLLKGKRRKEAHEQKENKGPIKVLVQNEEKGTLACDDLVYDDAEETPEQVVEEDVETQKKKQKEEEGPEDPFGIALNKYTRSILAAVEPFLRIDDSGLMPDFNKFTPWKMQQGTLTQAISHMAAYLCLVEETMAAAGASRTEGNLRPYHTSLLCPFKLMTRPSAEEYSALQIDMRGEKIEDYIHNTLEDAVEDDEGIALKKGSSSSSNEGLDIDHHEVAPQGNSRKQGRTDFKIFVRDKRIMRRKIPQDKLRELETRRLVALVESKLIEEEDAVFQAAAYARHEVLRNLQNMHIEPIYLIVLAALRWTYAILDVHSSLRLDDNKITAEAYSDYLEIEKLEGEGKTRSESELKLRLNEKIKLLKDNYKMSKFPNKKYLVGDLYLCHHWYDLPTALRASGFASSGACLFFEGFMRIIVGNRVLKWHEKDVDKVFNTRETFMRLGRKFRGGLNIKI